VSAGTASPVVVIGSGLAAVSFATTLRRGGYDGPLRIVGEDAEPPYDRPPLSKSFLKDGDALKIRLDTGPLADVDWVLGRRAAAIDATQRHVALDNGERIAWGTLVLATGTRARPLPVLAPIGCPVLTLRTLDDARRLRALLVPDTRLLLVGAGVIGLELAATARALGASVTVLEAQPRVMVRSVPATLSRFVEQRHRDESVDLRLGRKLLEARPGAVLLDDGSSVAADLVVVGIGVVANDELAAAAGLACDDGIVVDAHGRTAAEGIWAIGDVARQPHPLTGRHQRIETWANAQDQAVAAARRWLDAAAPPYVSPPWFWSDQYELRIQGVGLPGGSNEVVRGDPASGRFSLLQFEGDRLVGATCVSSARDFSPLRKLVGREFPGRVSSFADTAIDLRKLG
jgi:3-phenylpropionate/trans-cinnamate dioxygenase ferredoxin reductase subunit